MPWPPKFQRRVNVEDKLDFSCGDTFSKRKLLKLRRIELRLTSSADRILLGQAEARLEFRLHFLNVGSNVETQGGGKLICLPVRSVTGHGMSKVGSLLTVLAVKLRCLKFCTYPQETAEP